MGMISESFPPKSKFVPERDIPDLSGKVVIVTGGNTGIGKITVKHLLLKNAKVYMASRTQARAEAAIAELKKETGKEAIFLHLDLGNLSSVTKSANEFKSKEPALHILFNSAGVMIPPIDMVTDDGYDLQFGTNVLGHAHFTLSLVDQLEAGAKSSPDGKARVVNTSSSAAYLTSSIGLEFAKDGPKRKRKSPTGLYSHSKLGNAVFSNEFARRYAGVGITSNALNPGNLKTELQRHMPWYESMIVNRMLHPAPMGALTQLYVGTSPETVNSNGEWFIPWARHGNPVKAAQDPKVGAELWEWIEEQRKSHL